MSSSIIIRLCVDVPGHGSDLEFSHNSVQDEHQHLKTFAQSPIQYTPFELRLTMIRGETTVAKSVTAVLPW